METNRLKRKLVEGRLSLIAGNYDSADMIDFVGSLQMFDGVWIDMEHGPSTTESLPDLSRAADLWGMTSIVRVPAPDAAVITRILTLGANGVIVPHVNTREAAELVVDAAKFAPIGRRGVSGGRRAYGRSFADHYSKSNDETLVAVMIEELDAIQNLSEILKVPHIDMFFVSHYDLAQSMGVGADVDHPDLVAAYDMTITQIVAAGRVAAAAIPERDLAKYLQLGVRCLKAPGWQSFIATGASAFARSVETARS